MPTDYAFIVGCARSGTSILGELVAAHPRIHYVFEASAIWEWGGMGPNNSHRLVASDAPPPLQERIRDWFRSEAAGAPLLVEKNPRNILRIPYVRAIFPEARIVHIVRDGRDTACSMVPGCGGQHWSHLKPPDWETYFRDFSGIERCAHVWKDCLEIGLSDLENVPHLQVRYEDLLTSPRTVAAEVMSYLELDMAKGVEEFCAKISNDTASAYHAKHQDQWYRPDHRVRMGRWRENMPLSQQQQITELLAPMLRRLGYLNG